MTEIKKWNGLIELKLGVGYTRIHESVQATVKGNAMQFKVRDWRVDLIV
jgi:hypothetical protein